MQKANYRKVPLPELCTLLFSKKYMQIHNFIFIAERALQERLVFSMSDNFPTIYQVGI